MKKLLKKKTIILLSLIIVLLFLIFNIANIQKLILKKMYPKKYSYEVEKYASEYGIEKNLIYAIIKAESNFNEKAISRRNAKGLMQLMYDTAEDIAKIINLEIDEEKILEPDTNINIGTKYISILINKYKSIEVALAAYNAGSGNVDSWIANGTIKADGSDIENIPFKETNNYVRKTLRDYKIYNRRSIDCQWLPMGTEYFGRFLPKYSVPIGNHWQALTTFVLKKQVLTVLHNWYKI